jgi:transposase
MSEATTTTKKVDYFRLPRPLWRKLKKCACPKRRGRRRDEVADRGHPTEPSSMESGTCFGPAASGRRFIGIGSGCPRALSTSVFREMDEDGHLREADEKDGPVLRKGARWGRLEVASDGFQELRSAPLGGEKTGKNPTDRGKLGAKINLLVDERGAPISITLTGANRHDKMSAIDLIVSVILKRPAHKEQHLCADKAYDATDVREFVASEGYTAHITRSIPEGGAKAPSDRAMSVQRLTTPRRRRFIGREDG